MESELRRRNFNNTQNSKSTSNQEQSPAKKSRSAKLDTGFTAIILLTASLCLPLLLFPSLLPKDLVSPIDQALTSIGVTTGSKYHAVVIDAGSTGSRVLAFTFSRSLLTRALILEDELWKQEKPGLSSFADEPEKAAESIEKLIAAAKSRIPEANWLHTPVTLKATAGLRLLPKDKAEGILTAVEKILRESGFKPQPDLIEIMNPMEEGLFGWFTVNFLTGQLTELPSSFVSLDLGGGSTQITFAPKQKVSGITGRKHFTHNVTIMGQTHNVYSHSYLGLGLMAARMAVFKEELGNRAIKEGEVIESPCVTQNDPLTFKYQGHEYKIGRSKESSFEKCIHLVNNVINKENVHMPIELKLRRIAAFSYFYDKASERRLIPEKASEGTLKIAAFVYEAQRACDPYSNSEFYCVDLAFISSLLTKGYGLPPDKEISVFKKIRGHEASWALGLAYSILDK